MNTIGSLSELTLTVSWSMKLPALAAKKWHAFAPLAKFAAEYNASESIEQLFAWPSGTLCALEQGFEKHLGRNTGWQLDAIADRQPWIQAAQIFRRGVPYSQQTQTLESGSYCIRFHNGNKLPALAAGQGPTLFDKNVAALWGLSLRPQDMALDLNESTKSLESAAQIKVWLDQHPGVLTIVGGGILADAAAFAAALIKRPFRLVPTTLLAMLDACVGGKTGVNFGRFGKNQLGLFAFPTEVVLAPIWLKTLPEREFKAGLAEGYKHAVIKGDPQLAMRIAKLPLSIAAIEPILATLVAVKAKIISEDSSETGLRAVLNFGHTLAHALEKLSQTFSAKDPLLHGEAIGIGMLFALYLSHRLGHLKAETHNVLQSQLKHSRFLLAAKDFQKHLGLSEIPDGKLIDFLTEGVMQDKKNQESGSSEWVLIEDWGRFVSQGGIFTRAVGHQIFRDYCRSFFIESGLVDTALQVKLGS